MVAAHLLKPLGNPPLNRVKFFAAAEVLEQARNRTWLAKVSNAINQQWQRKNTAKNILSSTSCLVPKRQGEPSAKSRA
jgi:hypothetical protein